MVVFPFVPVTAASGIPSVCTDRSSSDTLGSPVFELIPAPDDSERRDEEDALMKAIHQLPASFREVILLHYYQNYGITEISTITGLPEGTISSRLSRGRKKLENILQGGNAL